MEALMISLSFIMGLHVNFSLIFILKHFLKEEDIRLPHTLRKEKRTKQIDRQANRALRLMMSGQSFMFSFFLNCCGA